MTVLIEKFIWDLTYACPLRCAHCYSESGRRAARVLERQSAMQIVELILSAQPKRISISGGEPLLVPWCLEASRSLHSANCAVTLFTSGWVMSEDLAEGLVEAVTNVAVSIDGPDAEAHDTIRGRAGAFEKAMTALGILDRTKARRQQDQPCYKLGVDYTVTRSRSDIAQLGRFVADVTSRFPQIDFIRFGAAIPSGLGAEQAFESELLTVEESVGLLEAQDVLAKQANNGAEVSVTDVRYFLPKEAAESIAVNIAHIEPDGALRAFPLYEAKVGNLLSEPLELLWSRSREWCSDAFVMSQVCSIRTMADWSRVTRVLDGRYGTLDDKQRIRLRSGTGSGHSPG
jgi:MoaA/NifB/PqqE/SkfB family radical SAM enzyme